MVNRERVSLSDSSERVGRWLMSTLFFFLSGHPLFDGRPLLSEVPAGRPAPRQSHYLE
ncbi:hypothetical protein Ate01nite_23290 [Actinoplanes teichomyceticus]|nr:hypothetical protein Ate01nite_23290 [Actinoplanes teichomyceticus]